MISSQISKVLRYALNAFPAPARSNSYTIPEIFEEKLNKLKACLDKTTASDIGFHDKYMTKEFWEGENQAPVGYIDIYEDIHVTLGVFILKPGMKMPLHDHPHMYGLLKVIAGQVAIHSYTVTDEEDYVLSPEKLPILTITAQKNPPLIINAQSDSVLLQPKAGNLHEIVCDTESAAAFIDVLSPPYDTLIRVDKSMPHSDDSYYSYLPRKCRFFEIVEQLKDDLVKMKECKSPSWFFTSREDYLGPKVVEPREDYLGPNVVGQTDGRMGPSGAQDKEGPSVARELEGGPNLVEPESGDSAVSSRSGSDSNSNYSNSNYFQ